jgi:hypothetical protein
MGLLVSIAANGTFSGATNRESSFKGKSLSIWSNSRVLVALSVVLLVKGPPAGLLSSGVPAVLLISEVFVVLIMRLLKV